MTTLVEKLQAIQETRGSFNDEESNRRQEEIGQYNDEIGYRISDSTGQSFWISADAFNLIVDHVNNERKENADKSPVMTLRNVYNEDRRDEINAKTTDKPEFIRVTGIGTGHLIPDDYIACELSNGHGTEFVYRLLSTKQEK